MVLSKIWININTFYILFFSSVRPTGRRRNLNQISDDEDSERREEEEENVYLNPSLEGIEALNPSTATNVYKNVMASVGSAATRGSSQQACPAHRELASQAAVIAEDELVGDDWLIEDVRPTNKRKHTDIDKLFATGGVPRSQRDPVDRGQTRSNHSRKNSGKSNNNNNSSSKKRRTEPEVAETNEEIADIDDFNDDFFMADVMLMDDNIPSNSLSDTLSDRQDTHQKPKPKKQQKLTHMLSVDRSVNRLSLNRSHVRAAPIFTPQMAAPQPSQPVTACQPVIGALMRLNVKIQDKTIMVPVSMQRYAVLLETFHCIILTHVVANHHKKNPKNISCVYSRMTPSIILIFILQL